ncbi:MAG: hypothetical protein NWF02_00700 [Candidatus Bathyarchaeota archaeon]|nr:hypothetical protein [Candidatus Bathyarchaeum sp.]
MSCYLSLGEYEYSLADFGSSSICYHEFDKIIPDSYSLQTGWQTS